MAGSASGLLVNSTTTNSATGFGQGIDVNSFVQLALNGDHANITNLQNQKSAIDSQSSALSQIKASLTVLQSAASALSDPLGALNSELATSSSSAVTATADSTAIAGSHQIAVTSLATTSSYYSGPVATSNTTLRSGDTIKISAGGHTLASVTTDASTNTLAFVAAAINNQSSAVHASVVNDATGSRLVVFSALSGTPGILSVTGSLFLPGGNAVAFTQAVAGQDAQFTVDNVPITSTSNQVSGVIPGVTLNLNSATGNTPATITLGADTSTITNAVSSFVSAYNTAIGAINGQFQVNSDGSGGGVLESDGSLREAQQDLLGAITYSTNGTGGQVNLTNLGIGVNDDGTLSVDSSALSKAIAANIGDVRAFLQNTTAGFAINLGKVLTNLLDPTSGALGLDGSGLSQSSQALSQHILDLQSALAVKQQNLVSVYAQVNTTLQLLPLLQSQLSQQLANL
jgi:flagellar hook-associated protein 2